MTAWDWLTVLIIACILVTFMLLIVVGRVGKELADLLKKDR